MRFGAVPRSGLYRLTLFERFLSLFTSVRPGEGASVRHLFGSAFLLTFSYYLLKPVREALLLSEGDAELGAYMDGAVAVMLIFMIPLYRQLYHNLADSQVKSHILRWVIGFFISNLLVFVLLARAGLSISIPFYIWLSIFAVMVVSQFWAFAADLFNTKSGQRLFVVIMVGSSIGAWAGAQTAESLSTRVQPATLLALAGLLLVAPLLLSIRAENLVPEGSGSVDPTDPTPEFGGFRDWLGGFGVVFGSRYLLVLALFILALNVVSSLGKYVLRALVKARSLEIAAGDSGTTAAEYILAFYGDYNAWISLVGLILQLLVVGRLFRMVGVRGAIVVLPVFMVLQFGLLALLPLFGLLRASMILQNALNYSVQSTTSQALFLPLTRSEKYLGKTIVETVFVRLGDCAQGLLVFLGSALLGLSNRGFIGLTLAFSVALLVLGIRLRGSHRELVAQRLSNVAPRLVRRLPNVYVPAGRLFMFSLPDECFHDPDPGDTLDYRAALVDDGGSLPDWIRFDRLHHTFTVRPPAGQGALEIEVTAADFDGHEASGRFRLSWGDDPVHHFD